MECWRGVWPGRCDAYFILVVIIIVIYAICMYIGNISRRFIFLF